MRVVELVELLSRYAPEREVRVACCIYEGSEASSEDLAITGVTTAFRSALLIPTDTNDQPGPLWIFAGRYLEADPKQLSGDDNDHP